jgi:hypothetical protein
MELDFAESVELCRRGETQECVCCLHKMLAQNPANSEASFLDGYDRHSAGIVRFGGRHCSRNF